MFSPDQALGIARVFLQSIEEEAKTTRKVLAAVPENQLDFKLGDKGRTARELLWHIVESEVWFGESIAAGSFAWEGPGTPAETTVAGMVAHYDRELPKSLSKVKALSGEDLVKTVDFFGAFKLPVVMYMNFWLVHTVHHRGQLSTYLRAMNAHVPSIYGGSADEPFQAPSAAAGV
jgi:uncharacterized damage-inducible protein DinB